MRYCKCMEEKGKLCHLIDEVIEFVTCPSKDEFSDIVFAVARIGRVGYVNIPGIRRHVNKINNRMQLYGCIRSKSVHQ